MLLNALLANIVILIPSLSKSVILQDSCKILQINLLST